MNVKNKSVGSMKRDEYREPILSVTDNKLELLREYAELFREWKSSKCAGLTAETFTACIQMCEALPAFAVHLIELGFSFVLLGHTQTDELEHRFGRYRQMSGANYYISIKQLMESEKRLKVMTLLKHTSLSPLELGTINENECHEESVQSLSDDFCLEEFSNVDFDLETSEIQLLCFVGGYIARSISGRSACEFCRSILLLNDGLPPVDCDDHSEFFDIVNRGGLKKPSDHLFLLVCSAYSIFAHLKMSPSFNAFLVHPNPSSLFCSLVFSVLDFCGRADVLHFTCQRHHNLVPRILRCLFNILAKNFVRNHKAEPKGAAAKKIAKLQSSS